MWFGLPTNALPPCPGCAHPAQLPAASRQLPEASLARTSDGAADSAGEPYHPPRTVADAADAVQRLVDACPVVPAEIPNLHRSAREGKSGYQLMQCSVLSMPAQLSPPKVAACADKQGAVSNGVAAIAAILKIQYLPDCHHYSFQPAQMESRQADVWG